MAAENIVQARKIDKTLARMIGDRGMQRDEDLALLGTSESLVFWMVHSGATTRSLEARELRGDGARLERFVILL